MAYFWRTGSVDGLSSEEEIARGTRLRRASSPVSSLSEVFFSRGPSW